ncbi:MAG: 30S ribosomal protein S6 [Patescibacteria group bacterium]|nr:30S ribosomal protein S6 [Patescibacteria group bacterium]
MEYELLFFTSASNEDRVETIKKELTEILESLGGKFLGDFHDIGKRKLAYPIKRDTHAFYSWARFTLDDEARSNIPEIGKRISLNDKVKRHIIVRADEIGKTASADVIETETEKIEADKVKSEISKPEVRTKPVEKGEKATLSELDEKLSEILDETPE